jgi:hypothetical protein
LSNPRQSSTIDPLFKRSVLFLLLCFRIVGVHGQSTSDSSHLRDTLVTSTISTDSLPLKPTARRIVKLLTDSVTVYHTDTLRYSAVKPPDSTPWPATWMTLLDGQPYFNFSGKPVHIRSERYDPVSYDGMFYLLVFLLFYFAIVKLFFGKYLANLLTIFFKASMRQQQLREQVLQSPFPSLLLNLLFVISGGLYGAFLARFYQVGNPDRFWLHFLYGVGILIVLYLVKYMILRITGWIFNINRAVETYLFVVFMTNKIIGIFLLPFLVLISFAGQVITEISITISLVMIGIFYIYRFVSSYATLHKEIKISGLHFILYLCALEIAPLLLIYKVLVAYLEKAY